MDHRQDILDEIIKNKLVAVVRGKDKNEAQEIISAGIEGGLKLIEVTYTNKDAAEIIQFFSTSNEEVIVGAGSVVSLEIAVSAVESGAQFIVGPNYDEQINEYCKQKKVIYIPGCVTPTEIRNAVNAGVEMIKLFPGDLVGPKYVKAIKAPMPDVRIMVTGGVNLNNLQEWFDVGVESAGLGSVLTHGTDYDYNKIVENARSFVSAVVGE